jgi:hypothetical protein
MLACNSSVKGIFTNRRYPRYPNQVSHVDRVESRLYSVRCSSELCPKDTTSDRTLITHTATNIRLTAQVSAVDLLSVPKTTMLSASVISQKGCFWIYQGVIAARVYCCGHARSKELAGSSTFFVLPIALKCIRYLTYGSTARC